MRQNTNNNDAPRSIKRRAVEPIEGDTSLVQDRTRDDVAHTILELSQSQPGGARSTGAAPMEYISAQMNTALLRTEDTAVSHEAMSGALQHNRAVSEHRAVAPQSDASSVTSGEELFTGTARLGTVLERLQMLQQVPILHQNVGHLRATLRALHIMMANMEMRRAELATTGHQQHVCCRICCVGSYDRSMMVLAEIIEAYEDLIFAQRITFDLTRREQDGSELSYVLPEPWN